MASTIDIADVITAALEAQSTKVQGPMPGKIVKYDVATKRADVLPMVKRPLPKADDSGRTFEALPTLPQIPVLWPRVGNFTLQGKLEEGDTGLLIFAAVPWGEWLATGDLAEPADARTSSIGYAAFLPGLYAITAPLDEPDPMSGYDLTIGAHDGSGAAIGFKNGEIMAGAGGVPLATHAGVNTWATAVETALNSAGFPVATKYSVGLANATTILKGK